MPALRELQELFWRALAEDAPPPALLARVGDTPRLGAAARVRVYTDAYRWRLIEVLREDFSRLAHHLGPDAFHALAGAYLARHPSRDPSVAEVGHALAEFCATRPELPPWAADLARLEWARHRVFVAADAVPLGLDDLRAVPPEEWAELGLALVPAAALLVTAWPAHFPWRGDEPPPAPARSAYRVWRQGWAVHHAVLDPLEETALRRVARGATFAAVCEDLDRPEDAGALLLRWVEDGLLRGAPRDPEPARRP